MVDYHRKYYTAKDFKMQILQMKNVSEAMNFDDVEIKTWDTVVNNRLIRDRTLSM